MSADDNQLYKVLGVEPKATHDQIKKAYRKLAAKYHPDKGDDDTGAKFAEVSKAYKTLINPETRETYDAESQLEIMARHNIKQAMTEFVKKSIEQVENQTRPVLFSSLVDHFKATLKQDKAALEGVEVKQKRMLKMHDKVKLKHCDDVYKETLRSVSISLKHDVDVLLANIELLEKINELLADYEADEPKPGELILMNQSTSTGGLGGLFR